MALSFGPDTYVWAAADGDRQWWAFRPLVQPTVPATAGDSWSHHPIDHFVYRKLAAEGMQPAPQADKATLVRRLTYDLWGLPPTPVQIDQYVEDSSPDAWSGQIDRLLADPRYGEHWGRYWLDVVRYAESDGWNKDAYRPDLWRYRDYVVRAFNQDKPYPEFVRQQLAGDEMEGAEPENLAASGFLRLGIYEYNQRDARAHWNDILNETTDVLGDVFLGLGIACARCHDHKFDPLLQTDYFRLRAFVEPVLWRDDDLDATPEQKTAYAHQHAIWEAATRVLRAQRDALVEPYYERKRKATVDRFPLEIQACYHKRPEQRSSWEAQMAYLVERQFAEEGDDPLKQMTGAQQKEYQALQQALAEYDSLKPAALPHLLTVANSQGPASPTVVPGDRTDTPIEPGFPAVLESAGCMGHVSPPTFNRAVGRRTALACWIGRGDNPLTMRVIVNRIWQQHFGVGLVATANDFGHLGQRPTHPELLDWLTTRFVDEGWSFKWLHKQILMSATWQQSVQHPNASQYEQQDSGESLLWRARIRRLQAESIRDAMLSVSGELQYSVGGPSVEAETARRGLYVKSFRNTPNPLLHAFDMVCGLKSVGQRDTTTTSTQALLMINGSYGLQRATRLAQRLQEGSYDTPDDLLQFAFRLTWNRAPTPSELVASKSFVVEEAPEAERSINPERLVDFCHVLLNSNEFIYVD
jgi:hypothetical protein